MNLLITSGVIEQINRMTQDGDHSVSAAELGLNANDVAEELSKSGKAIRCVRIPAMEEWGTDETYIWWGATEVNGEVVLWGVEPSQDAIWVEGVFTDLDEAGVASEASQYRIYIPAM